MPKVPSYKIREMGLSRKNNVCCNTPAEGYEKSEKRIEHERKMVEGAVDFYKLRYTTVEK